MMVRKLSVLAAVCAVTMTAAAAPASAGTFLEGAWFACQRQQSSVYVELSRSRYPETTDHWRDAMNAGHPRLLHIDRESADLHREQSLAGFPPRPRRDRDEYPVAMSREGGWGASVRYIDPADNRGSGASMGNQLAGWCEDQPFRIRFVG
jgi:Deoxyribonuclease NucA/NucB